MKIFFTCSYYGKGQYQKNYDLILGVLRKQPIELIGTEIGNYITVLPAHITEKYASKERLHYEAIRYGILNADAVVMEISQQDFQLGHEATLAIQAKKHILCLSVNDDYSKKISNEYFHAGKYSKYDVTTQIEDFLRMLENEKLSNRFNMFLTGEQVKYLQDISLKKSMTMSEYLRELINDDRKSYLQKTQDHI